MRLDICEIKRRIEENKVIDCYACSFEVANSKNAVRLRNLIPCKGRIELNNRSSYWNVYKFIPFGKNGKLLRSKQRKLETRMGLFDNYDECVEYYNEKIDSRIDELREQIAEFEELKMEVKQDE